MRTVGAAVDGTSRAGVFTVSFLFCLGSPLPSGERGWRSGGATGGGTRGRAFDAGGGGGRLRTAGGGCRAPGGGGAAGLPGGAYQCKGSPSPPAPLSPEGRGEQEIMLLPVDRPSRSRAIP